MTTIETLLLGPPVLLGPIALLLVLFRRTRRTALLSILPLVVMFVAGGLMLDARRDAKAQALGFLDADDRTAAALEGYIDPVAWAEVRKTLVAARRRSEASRRAAADAEAPRTCVENLDCWTNRHVSKAARVCAEAVERLAINSFEWRQGGALDRFPRAVIGQDGDVITYVGDAITFQNGFGATINHSYECDYDTASGQVLGVRAEAGRMP